MRILFTAMISITIAFRAIAQDYTTVDPELRAVSIDADAKEAFRCVRADGRGRLFVGGRDGLFVCEPKRNGGYEPRQLLYRFPANSWVNDIEIRGNDLYVLTANALYVVPDAVRKRENLKPRKLVWGVPLGQVHQGFHALAWGPEGDLYLSMGDALGSYGDARRPDHWGHWTFFCERESAMVTGGLPSPPAPLPKGEGRKMAAPLPEGEGRKIVYNGVGGIFRYKPEGDLQVVAGGLRNPSGLTFDRHWNLFSNDNVLGQLLHVTPHADFGWPRGGSWCEDILDGSDPSVPVGQCYYDDALLPAKYRHNLLIARPDIKWITHGPIAPRGVGLQAREDVLLRCKNLARPINVTVDGGGRIFAIIAYSAPMDPFISRGPMNAVKGELVMITTAGAAPAYVGYEAAETSLDLLWSELSDPSWQRRQRAHVELMRRGSDVWKAANKRLLTTKANDPALHHLIWLAARSQQGSLHLLSLVAHRDPLVRMQAIRALSEFPEQLRGEPTFTEPLLDEHPQVKLAAILAHVSPKVAWSRPIHQMVAREAALSKEAHLRQAATRLLAEKATRQQLDAMCSADDAATRLAGVLAAGLRLTTPPVHKALASHLPLAKPREEACVIEYADGKVDLRAKGRVGSYTFAEHWKVDMHTEEQELLFKLLRKMLSDGDEGVRLQAAFHLSLLKDARSEPEIARMGK